MVIAPAAIAFVRPRLAACLAIVGDTETRARRWWDAMESERRAYWLARCTDPATRSPRWRNMRWSELPAAVRLGIKGVAESITQRATARRVAA